jgi:predicted  nucleic acid-binding Zn-ribbon protein
MPGKARIVCRLRGVGQGTNRTAGDIPMTNDRKLTWGAGIALAIALIALAWIVSSGREERAVLIADLEAERVARAEVAEALAALEAAGGDLATVETRRAEVEARQAEIEAVILDLETQAEATRATAEAEIVALTERRDIALADTEATEAELGQMRALLKTQSTVLSQIAAQRDVIAAEVDAAQSRLTEIDDSLTEQLDELASVGARLENAREQEASLRQTLAGLQAEAASIAEELADAEARAQRARAAENEARQAFEAMEREMAGFEARRDALTTEVAELAERRDTLEADATAAETQRSQVQTELSELTALLAARSAELSDIETRISAALTGAAAGPLPVETTPGSAVQVGPGFAPGRFESGDVSATFASDGTFRMANEARGESLAGQYVQEAGLLILSEVEGDLRAGITFPLTCTLAAAEGGFRLGASAEGRCGPLVGATFVAAGQ